MKTDLRRLVANFAKRGNREDKGRAGELFARKWFEQKNLDYFPLPQTPDTMPSSLASCGGKRPDFAVALEDDDSVIYVDAKFHATGGLESFTLEERELQKFVGFREWVENECGDHGERDVIFMLFPIELNGDRFVWIHLDEMLQATKTELEGKPARTILLSGRDGLWVDCVTSGA